MYSSETLVKCSDMVRNDTILDLFNDIYVKYLAVESITSRIGSKFVKLTLKLWNRILKSNAKMTGRKMPILATYNNAIT